MRKICTMKKLTSILILFIVFTINSYSQNEKETIDFLNSKLATYAELSPTGESIVIVVKTEIENQTQRKQIVIETYGSQRLFSTEKFFPEHITGINTLRNGYGNLIIIATGRGSIKYRYNNEEKYTTEFRLILKTSDEEVYRIKKALEHLLKLNGGKLVNDDLFKN